MKTSTWFVTIMLFVFVLLLGCQKEDTTFVDPETGEIIEGGGSNGIGPGTILGERGLITNESMVLGGKRVNPYSVANMTIAWNNLYSNTYTSLPPTHLYVRFLPADAMEDRLLDDLDLVLFDYPVDYEIQTEGEFYHDPSIPADEITWQYTVVEPGFAFPPIQYEILEELVIAPYDSYLTAEAFRITGNSYKGFGNGPEGFTPCAPDCPNYPDCVLDQNIPCEYEPPTGGGGSGGGDPASPCTPSSPDWPDCLMVPYEDDPYGPPTHT